MHVHHRCKWRWWCNSCMDNNHSLRLGAFTCFVLAVVALIGAWAYGYRFSSTVQVGLSHGLPSEMYPLWNGGRAAIHGGNPYAAAVTSQSEVFMYGATREALNLHKGQQFAYPIFASVAELPLLLLPWPIANA